MNVRLELDAAKVMRGKFDPRFQQAQQFLDSEVLRCSTPYVPMRSGALMQSGISGTRPGSGKVTWNSPYARYQYYGLSFHHSTDKHPQACAQWFEKAKAVYLNDWVSGAQSIIGGK